MTFKALFGQTCVGVDSAAFARQHECMSSMIQVLPLLLTAGLQTSHQLEFKPCSNTEECIRVANRSLVQAQYSPASRELILTPVKKGETTIVLRDEKGTARQQLDLLIVDVNLKRKQAELQDLLKSLAGITVSIKGDRIVIDGASDDPAALKRVALVAQNDSYRPHVLNAATLSPSGLEKAAAQVENELGSPGIKVRAWNGSLLLEGKAASATEAKRLERLAEKLVQALQLKLISKLI